MKRTLLVSLIILSLSIVALLLAATRESQMLPLVIVFELLLVATFGLRYVLLYRAFAKKRD